MRDQSLFGSLCAVLLLLAMLMPICSADVKVLNATYDGSVATGIDANWTVMRNAPGDSHGELETKVYSGMTLGNLTEPDIYDEHWRGLVTWDTSDIPDDATITSATISVYGAGKMPELGVVNFCVIDAFPANQLAFVDRDYQRTTFTRFATDMPFDTYNKNTGWNTISLNSLGLNNISKTGYTTFMFTHSADVDNTNLTWVAGPDGEGEPQASGFQFQGVNNTYKPYITIYYDSSAVLPVLTVSANLTTVTAGTPTNVKFTVRNATSTLPVNGATVTLTGVATGSGTTGADGNATISVNAGSAGTITATASLTGYTSGTTTVTAMAPLPVLTVNASPTSVTAGTPTNVKFTVKNQPSGLVVSGATVTLTGVATGSGTTGADGNATISVNAGSAGAITATASMTGYTSNTTTVTANPAPVVLTPDKIGIYQGGVWYLDNSGNGAWGAGDSVYSFGAPGWQNVTGDWNHDGKTDIGVTNGQQWYLDMNNNGAWDGATDRSYNFGAPGWKPVVGDWNATGYTNIGVTNGQQWYLDWNGNGVWDGSDKVYSFGATGWIPIVDDWNHDGKTDIGITNGQQWYLDMNTDGVYDSGVDKAYSFGAPGWTPVVGDWNATGYSNIGVTNGQQWYLDMNNNGVYDSGVDKAYSFGAPGWTPIIGKWK